ncbi:hotdog fold thioesterase [Micrococcus sp.]|uniref:hotdog fold thioesterase n=1 Tax=Micrococcus sp. TaxID=1271 RepID=UPI0039C5DB65
MADPAAHPFAHLSFTPGATPSFPPEQAEALARTAGIPPELAGRLDSRGLSPLALKLGIVFLEVSAQRTVATMPVAGNEQPVGLLHGGAHLVLAETLGSVAAAMHAGPDRGVVGTEIGATHHRAARSGLVTGTATAVHLGRTLTTHEIVMTDEQGRRLSTARMTNMVLEPR